MSAGPLAVLGPGELEYTPEAPEFETLAALELGAAGSADDGFDLALSEAARGIGGLLAGHASLDGDLGTATQAESDLAQDDVTPVAADLAPGIEGSDQALAEFEREFVPVEPPAPVPPPSGTVGGVPVSGGGTGGTGRGVCDPWPCTI